jgi:hypothetical protein
MNDTLELKPSALDARTETYMIFNHALKEAADNHNAQTMARIVRRICLLYVEDFPELQELANEAETFVKELLARGPFKGKDLTSQERQYYGQKVTMMMMKFESLDSKYKLGEEDNDVVVSKSTFS